MVQARERRAMVLIRASQDSEAAFLEIANAEAIVEMAQFSEATRAKLRNRLGQLMGKFKLIDDEFGSKELEVSGIFMAPQARKLSRYPTRAARVARNMIGRGMSDRVDPESNYP
jgi:hypothetical protein